MAERSLAQVWRATVDWPRLLGTSADLAPLRAARNAVAAGDHAALGRAIAQAMFGGSTPPDLRRWLETADRPGARLWRAARGLGRGIAMPPPLGARDARWFGDRLMGDAGFAALPETEDGPADPAPLAGLEADGPMARRIAGWHAQAIGLLQADDAADAVPLDAAALAPGLGAAVVATARGPLAALVAVNGGRIADLRLSAPSEWALHPRGSLVRLLHGTPERQARARTHLALAACDPCAEIAIVREAADA